MSYNIFILCHYSDTTIHDMNSSITYNDRSSLLLIGNLGMSYAEIKETICYEHR
jgi:hypothetical protein